MLKVYDKFGNVKTLDWLYQQFGPVEVVAPSPLPAEYFAVVELREADDIGGVAARRAPCGVPIPVMMEDRAKAPGGSVIETYAAIVALLLDGKGEPVVGERVVFWWPDAPSLPGSGWWKRGVTGKTKENGTVDFPMGPGAYYWPPNQGPHHLWVFGEGRSEIVKGLGMIGGTNHRHLDVVYRWMKATEPPPVPPMPPEEPNVPAAIEALCRAREATIAAKLSFDAAIQHLQKALDALKGSC